MIVYDGLKNDFMRSVESGLIAKEIEQNILDKLGRHTTENEFMSWENSMLRCRIHVRHNTITFMPFVNVYMELSAVFVGSPVKK